MLRNYFYPLLFISSCQASLFGNSGVFEKARQNKVKEIGKNDLMSFIKNIVSKNKAEDSGKIANSMLDPSDEYESNYEIIESSPIKGSFRKRQFAQSESAPFGPKNGRSNPSAILNFGPSEYELPDVRTYVDFDKLDYPKPAPSLAELNLFVKYLFDDKMDLEDLERMMMGKS